MNVQHRAEGMKCAFCTNRIHVGSEEPNPVMARVANDKENNWFFHRNCWNYMMRLHEVPVVAPAPAQQQQAGQVKMPQGLRPPGVGR